MLRPVLLPQEGRFAIVTKRGPECGGREGAERRTADLAYGKAVWSWRPDAGVKLAMMLRITLMMVARKPGHQGEPGISRQPTAQGRPGCPGCTCMLVCISCLAQRAHETAGASRRPAFPAPSSHEGDNVVQNSGESPSRERRCVASIFSWRILRDAAQPRLLRMRSSRAARS